MPCLRRFFGLAAGITKNTAQNGGVRQCTQGSLSRVSDDGEVSRDYISLDGDFKITNIHSSTEIASAIAKSFGKPMFIFRNDLYALKSNRRPAYTSRPAFLDYTMLKLSKQIPAL
jgi:hypothetical protein